MEVRLATLNVWALPGPLGHDVGDRIDAIGLELPSLNLDVMAFQEVWTRSAAKRLRRAGRRAGLGHAWTGAAEGGGLLVLSRYPITAASFEPFEVRGEAERAVTNLEYLSGKGFATIRILTPAGPLVLVNTHLHARYSRHADHHHVPHRTAQAIQVASRFMDRSEPVVAVGDFNFREGEADYQVLTDILGMRDVAATLDNRQNTTLGSNVYRGSKTVARRKDYVFARNGRDLALQPRAVRRVFDDRLEIEGEPANYSDHAGLVAELELGPATRGVLPAPSEDAVDRAARVVAEGESIAAARRSGSRKLSSIGIGVAAAAALSAAPRRMSRRRLLRGALASTALLAVTPGVGFSIVSEVFAPGDIRAFRNAADQLAQLARIGESDRIAQS